MVGSGKDNGAGDLERRWIEEELLALEMEDVELDPTAKRAVQQAVDRLRRDLEQSGQVTEHRVRWTKHLLAWAKSSIDSYREAVQSAGASAAWGMRRRSGDDAESSRTWLHQFEDDLCERGWMPFDVLPDAELKQTRILLGRQIDQRSDAWSVEVELNAQRVPEAQIEEVDDLEGYILLDGVCSEECLVETEVDPEARVIHLRVIDSAWKV